MCEAGAKRFGQFRSMNIIESNDIRLDLWFNTNIHNYIDVSNTEKYLEQQKKLKSSGMETAISIPSTDGGT